MAALAVLALGMQSSAATPGTITWSCNFSGSYTEGSEKTAFTWNVKWVESDTTDDKLTGTASTDGVSSKTTGTCSENTCKIDEVFGDGKKFFWVGTYVDAEAKTENAYNTTFKGTWGPAPADRKSSGTWTAKAVCKA